VTDVRIIPNLSILPGIDDIGNQVSFAETGAVKAAISAEPVSCKDHKTK
jgi:hypothetical protein